MPKFFEVAKAEDIKNYESISVVANGHFIAVGNNNGVYFAVSDICPHAGMPIGGGFVEEGCITCPHHFWQFDVKTGECPHIKGEKIETYECKILDGKVYVKI